MKSRQSIKKRRGVQSNNCIHRRLYEKQKSRKITQRRYLRNSGVAQVFHMLCVNVPLDFIGGGSPFAAKRRLSFFALADCHDKSLPVFLGRKTAGEHISGLPARCFPIGILFRSYSLIPSKNLCSTAANSARVACPFGSSKPPGLPLTTPAPHDHWNAGIAHSLTSKASL